MSNILILYYTRTGTTQRVASALAEKLNASSASIECDRYDGGWLRYLLAGYESVKGRLPPISPPSIDFTEYDLVVLGTPIWTSYPALPMRAFLSGSPRLPSRVALFLTHGGHSPPQKAVQFVEEMLPGKLIATLGLQQAAVKEGKFVTEINRFAESLQQVDMQEVTGKQSS